MNASIIGLDIAKSVFQVHGIDRSGNQVLKRKLRRSEMHRVFAALPPCVIGIEACNSSHYWGRQLAQMGHIVRLIPTQYVKPFTLGGKNDANDAAAICTAVARPDMHFVPVKTAEQQSVQSLHRMRERLTHERTSKSNQIRSMFAEEGIIFGLSVTQLKIGIADAISDPAAAITPILRRLGSMYLEQVGAVERWLKEINNEIKAIFEQHEDCKLLASIPGVGPVIATAITGTVPNAGQFKNGRQLAAWIGLTPKQRSSGGKTKLGGITKHGDTYLRMLLVHGARAVIRYMEGRNDRQSLWLRQIAQRRHRNVAIIALANKIARMVWAVLAKREPYRAN
jgi:transposase